MVEPHATKSETKFPDTLHTILNSMLAIYTNIYYYVLQFTTIMSFTELFTNNNYHERDWIDRIEQWIRHFTEFTISNNLILNPNKP